MRQGEPEEEMKEVDERKNKREGRRWRKCDK